MSLLSWLDDARSSGSLRAPLPGGSDYGRAYIPDPMGRLDRGWWGRRSDPFGRLPTDTENGGPLSGPVGNPFGLSASVGGKGADANRRADVAKVEELLGNTGHLDLGATGGPTGYYGGRLKAGIEGFQKERGLAVDGRLEPDGETIRALRDTLGGDSALRSTTGRGAPEQVNRIVDGLRTMERAGVDWRRPPAVSGERADSVGYPQTGGQPAVPHRVGRPGEYQIAAEDEPPVPLPPSNEDDGSPQAKAQGDERPWGQSMIDAFEDEWLAIQQGTSPVMRTHDGTPNYEKAPDEAQLFYAETGQVDPTKHVVLRDPATNRPAVWLRNPEMEDSGLVRLSRIFGLGMLPEGGLARAGRTAAQAARAGRAEEAIGAGAAKARGVAAPSKVALPRVSRAERPLTREEFGGMPETGTFDPRRIRTAQDTAGSTFKDGRSVAEMAEGLRSGRLKASEVEPIRLVEKDGKVWTLDHRRLIAFREAGVDIPYRKVSWKSLNQRQRKKVTTKDDGMSIMTKDEEQK